MTATGGLDRTLFWAPWSGPGMEQLRLRAADEPGYVATGLVLGQRGDTPFRLDYKIKCDERWHTRKVILELTTPRASTVRTLRSDGKGNWRDEAGEPLASLAGCQDVDIAVTPFTNTLAMRRLDLPPGRGAAIRAVYIAAPLFSVRPVEQHYACRDRHAGGAIWTYDGIFRNFKADLAVDPDGLVLDYPETFRRVYPVSQ